MKTVSISKVKRYDENGKRIFEIDEQETQRINKINQRAYDELEKRYEKCDAQGHIIKDYILNRCHYCFRRLEYSNLAQKNLKKRKNIPWYRQPFDAPDLVKEREKDIEFQRKQDWIRGLKILSKRIERREKFKGLLRKLF